jgi:pimeloyl-ACP methyl ester carboxylesterase
MTERITVAGDVGEVGLTLEDRGDGRPFLLLHGGAGPASMVGFATRLADSQQARTLAPIHPGFAGTERPDGLDTITGLARVYSHLLDQLALDDLVVVGNSIGGWIAAELALLRPHGLSHLILMDAVGIDVPGHPVSDVSGMAVPEIMQLSFHDPQPFLRNPASLSLEEQAVLAANQAALQTYAPTMTDHTLSSRLAALFLPTLVLWGDSDGIVGVEYGRAYAEAIPGARFLVLPETGHMPQLETPNKAVEAIRIELETAGIHATEAAAPGEPA